MHEWALAESIVYAVEGEAQKYNLKRITSVLVKVGELQQAEVPVLRFAIENILASSKVAALLKSSDVKFEIEKATLRCNVCGSDWAYHDSMTDLKEDEIEAIHFVPEVAHTCVRCPICGSPDFSIKNGRGVWIEDIEGEQ